MELSGAISRLCSEIAPGRLFGALWALPKLEGPERLFAARSAAMDGAKRRPSGPWALGPAELSTGQLRRRDRSSVCEEIRVVCNSEELEQGRRQQPAGLKNRPKRAPHSKPTCIMSSTPLFMDFGSLLCRFWAGFRF